MLCKSILGRNASTSHQLESQREKRGKKKKKACLFEPVQVVCLESGEAHVVAAGAAVAGRAGRAGNAYFVGGISDPVTPEREAIQLRYKHATECSLSTYRISNT